MLRTILFGHRKLEHTLRVLRYLERASFASLEDLHEDLQAGRLVLLLFLMQLEDFHFVERGRAQHDPGTTLWCLTAIGRRFVQIWDEADSATPAAS